MPLSINKKLGLGDSNPTAMLLLIDDQTVKRPIWILNDVLFKVETFIFPSNIVILDYEVHFEVPIILWSQFLATYGTFVDIDKGKLMSRLNNDEITFNICSSMKQNSELQMVSTISWDLL